MSTNPAVSMRFRRYDLNRGFGFPEIELDLGHGMEHVQLGNVGIEQLWTRFDPRFNYTFVTWQYFRTELQTFGSNPFLYSDDDGATWRTADGAAWTQFPIHYSEINDLLVPFDHLAAGESSNWLVSDLGVSPNGVFWMTVRALFAESVDFWFFNADAGIWESRPMAHIQDCKPFACGVTEDDIVFVYSDIGSEHILKARFSADDGDTWSDPILLDVLDPSQRISWASFVQPADNYAGNSARFFYGYYVNGTHSRYQNNIRWIRFNLDAILADLNGDGTVDIVDFLMLLAAWGPCEQPCPPACLGDIDGDCTVGITDMLTLLANWG